jgi:hypothetical protein
VEAEVGRYHIPMIRIAIIAEAFEALRGRWRQEPSPVSRSPTRMASA